SASVVLVVELVVVVAASSVSLPHAATAKTPTVATAISVLNLPMEILCLEAAAKPTRDGRVPTRVPRPACNRRPACSCGRLRRRPPAARVAAGFFALE
ncbi:MAG: hypothetical protein KY441_10815, partial [Actinobacteria bacterium]|nr:hypothetical protein [Actinomycetota bacterium]